MINGEKKYFDQFIEEIQTLDVRVINGYLDLSHYSQDGKYPYEIVRLQQLAINDVLLLSTDQIERQLKRLERIKRQFSRFWHANKQLYKDLREEKYDNTFLELKVYPCFIVPKHNRGLISKQFIIDLHDAAAYKDGALAGFEEQIKEVLKNSNQSVNQNIAHEQQTYLKDVRSFLKYLQNERFVSNGEIHGKEIGYMKREPVSILDMEEFIKEKTEYDLRKLKALRQDVQWYIRDEEMDAKAKNEETKRNSNDEFFLADRAFWKQKYDEALNNLSDIEKLRVRVLQRWIAEKKISDDELELRDQFRDDIVDAVAAKQTYDRLEPGEGTFYPDTSQLYSFLCMIDFEIQKIESTNTDRSDKLNEDPPTKIGRPREYNKQTAIDYFEENKKELYKRWVKYGGKSAVGREILMKAYKGDKKPHVQTIVDYIKDHLNANSEK